MSGIVGLSYASKDKREEFIHDLFWEVHFLQHLKMGYGGLATQKEDGSILLRTHRGTFKETFANDLEGFCGPSGIGSTTSLTREPYKIESSSFSEFVLAFSGKINNFDELVEKLVRQGHSFERLDEVVLISKLITSAGYNNEQDLLDNIFRVLKLVVKKVKGSFVLIILTKQEILAFRSPDGHHQLFLGKKQGALVVTSELPQIDNQGFTLVRELEKGELLHLYGAVEHSVGRVNKKGENQPCIFTSVYYGNPPSINFGITNVEFRRRLGRALAKKDILSGFVLDVIIPIPDSGRFHAEGYFAEYRDQFLDHKIDKLPEYRELLIKYSLAARSFTPDDADKRKLEGEKKIIPAVEIDSEVNKKRAEQVLVVVDDSLVRGTQMKSKLVPKIKELGFKEIHVRFGYPKILSACNWAHATKKSESLAAVDQNGDIRTNKEIAKILGVNSCGFNFITNLEEASGLCRFYFCYDCANN